MAIQMNKTNKVSRGKGAISPDMPSILVANTLEVIGDSGDWTNIFTRTEEPVLEDYLDLGAREEFVALADLSYDKKDVWEQNEKAKVYGSLEKNDTGDKIAVFDDEGKEIGKILVDSYTDFSQFYLGKLGHFDKFWFYLKVKETVDWSQRRRTREMFHVDVVFASGSYPDIAEKTFQEESFYINGHFLPFGRTDLTASALL